MSRRTLWIGLSLALLTVSAALLWYLPTGSSIGIYLSFGISITSLIPALILWSARGGTAIATPPENSAVIADNLVDRVEEALHREVIAWYSKEKTLPVAYTVEPDVVGVKQDDIGELFAQLPARRLVILGDPGSGKTQLAAQLALRTLERRGPGDAVPVLLHAPAWDPRDESMDSWLSRHLSETYQLPSGSASRLVANGLVLPVIDAVDELPAELRAVAFRQLNQSGSLVRPVVLTCRTRDYEQQAGEGGNLFDATVLRLLPLAASDVADYFDNLPGKESKWQPIVSYLRANSDSALASALSTPIMNALLRTVYSGDSDPKDLADAELFHERAEIENYLLDQAVAAVVAAAAGQSSTPAATNSQRQWLATLATIMNMDSSRSFAWWRVPMAAPAVQGFTSWVSWAGLLATAMTIGLVAWNWQIGIAAAVPLALGFISSRSWTSPVRVPRRVALHGWSLPVAIALAASAGFLLGAGALILPVRHEAMLATLSNSRGKRDALWTLGAVLLISCFVSYFQGSPADLARRIPALKTDRWISIAQALAVAAFLSVCCVAWLPARGPTTFAFVGLSTFLVILLGGSAWAQYVLTRLVLRDRLPWRLDYFLSRAEDAGVLRRTEGVTQFRYGVLQERLAAEGTGGQGTGQHPVLQALDEIVKEVPTLPEVNAYIGVDPHGVRRGEVQNMARTVVTENLGRISATGSEQYKRFQQARDLMAGAIGNPWWSRPVRVYGFVAAVGASFAIGTFLLIIIRSPVRLRWTVAGVIVAAVVCALSQLRRIRGGHFWPLSLIVRLAAWVTACAILLMVVSFRVHQPAKPASVHLIAIVAVLATLLLTFLWAAALPHARAQGLLHSDDPLKWPATVETVRRRHDAALQARRDWLTTLARDGVVPLIRNRLRQGQRRDPLTLGDLDPARLGGIRRSDELVETTANERTSWLLNKLESGSIGISGTRGAGKTTLLQRYCTYDFGGTSNDLLLLVSAPTAYDRREFLVHMFTEVCQQLAGTSVTGTSSTARAWSRLQRFRAGAAVLAGLCLIIGTLMWSILTSAAHSGEHHRSVLLLVAGALLALSGTASALWTSLRAAQPKRRASEAAAAAAEYLRELRFQSSVSRTRDGKLSLPGGFEFGASGEVQRTEQSRTYPELVAQFRSLLDQVGLERRPLGGRVVIGIDELDKMASVEDAETFLNDLKAVFGVRGCYFIVAVSEDALETFDRRTVGVRTAFDTAFDAIVRVDPFNPVEAKTLLERRGVSLPEPFLWLCQTLSGGLPRDLLRSVLALSIATSTKKLGNFGDLARELVENDFKTVLQSQLRFASAQPKDYSGIVNWLVNDGDIGASAARLDHDGAIAWAATLEDLILKAPSIDEPEAAIRFLKQTKSYLYHIATMVRIFVDSAQTAKSPAGTSGESNAQQSWPPAGIDEGAVDQLAKARSVIAAQPDKAWKMIEGVRAAAAGVQPLIIPAPPPPPGSRRGTYPPKPRKHGAVVAVSQSGDGTNPE